MTRETIILPIKCSTLKTVDTYLMWLIRIELVVLFILLAGKFLDLRIFLTPEAMVTYAVSLATAIIFGVFLFFGWVIIVIGGYIIDHFPTLECIKDDDTP